MDKQFRGSENWKLAEAKRRINKKLKHIRWPKLK